MSRYKGRPSQRQLEQAFPNWVEIVIPPGGLGHRLLCLYGWLRVHGVEYAHWSRSDRSRVTAYAVWGFASDADAVRFDEYWQSIRELDQQGLLRILDEQQRGMGVSVPPAEGHRGVAERGQVL